MDGDVDDAGANADCLVPKVRYVGWSWRARS